MDIMKEEEIFEDLGGEPTCTLEDIARVMGVSEEEAQVWLDANNIEPEEE